MISDNTQAKPLDKTAVMQSVILPNELRFGIYLQELTSNDVFQVEKAFFTLLELNLECSRPIPLTEEWLLKFGFSTTDYKNGYIGIDHKVGGIITDFVLTYPLVIGEFQKHFIWEHSKFKYKELKYVHQLQNLYFALTNEELSTNLLTKNK
jgi:hypothetical protein